MTALRKEVPVSPTGWMARHVRRYVETDGGNGRRWYGKVMLPLTSRSRKSSKPRRTASIYGQDGDSHLLVASNAGAPRHPAWYLNLIKHPKVHVQVSRDKFVARAHTASVEARPRLWRLMASTFPQYDTYQAKAGWDIPVVIVELVG
jgi:deazaflavin-dependent oxidoreductase (nitroreductase family)